MTVPIPTLDDRTFQDIVDEAKRLIPQYCKDWTNHNLSDPGIALIELFARMTELTLYRINQLPDRLFRTFLDLVGIDLHSARAARAELTFWLSAAMEGTVTVPARTQVGTALQDRAEAPVFMTDEVLSITQPVLIAAVTSDRSGRYVDCWDDLRHDQSAVTCFSSPVQPGDAFYLGFAESLAGNVIRLDLDADAEGIGIDPEHPPLAWEVWSGSGWMPTTVQMDTTGGLNRPGVTRLSVGRHHVGLTLGTRSAYWLRVRLTHPAEGHPTYEASPRIRGIRVASLGGTVSAHHAQPAPGESLGQSTGEPGQVFAVRHTPVLPRRFDETVRVLTEQGSEDWTEVPDFANSGPDDRHVVWAGDSGEVRFGPRIRQPDGHYRQHGAIPASGAEILVSGYRYGGGAHGNVGAGTLTVLRTAIPFIDRVENLERADGGVDSETVENAKARGPITLRTGQRAVTAADYERLTLDAAPTVARARCLAPAQSGGPVRLLLVPRLDQPPDALLLDHLALSNELVDVVRLFLDERRTIGTNVEIGTPYYQGVTVTALVHALPERPVELVRQRVTEALYRYINPLVGGVDGSGWPFDADLNAAKVMELLLAVEGVKRVEEVVLFEADARTQKRHGRGREVVPLDPQSLFLSFNHRVVVR